MRRSPFPTPGMGGGGGGDAVVRSVMGRLVARGRPTKPLTASGNGTSKSSSNGRSAAVSPRRERVRLSSPPPPSATTPRASASTCWGHLPPFTIVDDWLEVGSAGEVEEVESDRRLGRDDAVVVRVEVEEDRERLVFAPPSREEIHEAISGIQKVTEAIEGEISSHEAESSSYSDQFLDVMEKETISAPLSRVSSVANSIGSSVSSVANSIGSAGSDWIEPTMQLNSGPNFYSREYQNVLDAFHLLKTNQSIQNMVIALSSDKTVWDAVMKNQVVQEFKRALDEDDVDSSCSDDNGSPVAVLMRIMASTKAKFMEFFEIVGNLVHEFLHPDSKNEKSTDPIGDVVRTSFMLSVVVFIVVTIARVRAA